GGGPVAVLLHSGGDARHVCARLEPAARPHRARPGRDPRSAHRVRGDGHPQRALQVARVRRIGDVYRRPGRPRRARRPVRRPRQLRRVPFDRLSRRHRGGRPRLDQRGPVRCAVHRIHPEHRRRDLEGRAVGDLRRVHDRFCLPDARRRRRRHPHALDEKEITMKIKLVCLGAVLAAFAFAAAAQKKYDPGASDTEIKVGNTNPYSGPASAYGAIGKSIDAYFRMVNDQGGINGRKVSFISYDDGYSPPKTVEMARKLVEQDQVLFLFQTLGTPSNTAIHKYMNLRKVPQLHVATGASKWNDPKNFPWTMGWQPNYQTEARIYARHILKTRP